MNKSLTLKTISLPFCNIELIMKTKIKVYTFNQLVQEFALKEGILKFNLLANLIKIAS